MVMLSFQDFAFREEKDSIKVNFLRLFSFTIEKEELRKIAPFEIKGNTIEFQKITQKRAEKSFSKLLNRGFQNLTNNITKNPTLYIHKNSGIPLIGSLSFGIVDKGSDLLEIKPLSSCNTSCIFCSVDEGFDSKKTFDVVVEKDYLVEETRRLLEFKKHPMHLYINPQGEPLLYAEIVELVHDLSRLPYVKEISIITNGILLTEKLAAGLIDAGLTSFNVSLHSLRSDISKEIMHTPAYNIKRILQIVEKIKGRIDVILTPVWMFGVNDEDIEDIVRYAKKQGFEIGIQNFMINKRGRNPVKERSFDFFYEKIKEIEKKCNIVLIQDKKIGKTRQLSKPFKKGDIITAEIISRGRYPYESYAVAKNRVLLLSCPFERRRTIRVEITKDAYNVFYAKIV
ncbi:radical SAM protein [Candidatus Woesearchaeota archaeon]|nr:radical SAM protein [Candidatus Woesearchaeota archaeon]